MKILITGGEGFVGTALQSKYADKYDITSLDCCDRSNSSVSTKFEKVNLLKKIELSDYKFDGIIHLGGISRVKDGEANKRKCFEVNVQGTVNILDFAIMNGIRWVLIGGTVEGEDNAYGLSKKIANNVAEYYSKKELKIGVLKFSTIYGSIFDAPGKLIPILTGQAIKNFDIIINDGSLFVDFIHLDDIVFGIDRAVEFIDSDKNKLEYFEVSLCSGVNITLKDLANVITSVFQSKSKIIINSNTHAHKEFDYSCNEFSSLIENFPRISIKNGIKKLKDSMLTDFG
jgi:nucleoside-diphosphate-sugar epimerase